MKKILFHDAGFLCRNEARFDEWETPCRAEILTLSRNDPKYLP